MTVRALEARAAHWFANARGGPVPIRQIASRASVLREPLVEMDFDE